VIAWRPDSGAQKAGRKPLAAGDSPWGLQACRALLGCHLSDQPPRYGGHLCQPRKPSQVQGGLSSLVQHGANSLRY
jgi:hypothetical protein